MDVLSVGRVSVDLYASEPGVGFDGQQTFTKSVGVGLAGMRERMKQLGGTLEVASSPYGVAVKCRLGATEPEKNLSHG